MNQILNNNKNIFKNQFNDNDIIQTTGNEKYATISGIKEGLQPESGSLACLAGQNEPPSEQQATDANRSINQYYQSLQQKIEEIPSQIGGENGEEIAQENASRASEAQDPNPLSDYLNR